MESSIIILNSFNGNFYFSNPARNNNPVRILVMQYKTLHSCFNSCFYFDLPPPLLCLGHIR